MEADMKRAVILVLLPVVCLASATLAGCGRRGDLYLPGEARDIVTRPVQTPDPGNQTETPNSPQTVDSPETPPTPAAEVTAPAESEEEPAKKK
jgi:predicted small lipoprotein YifL